MPKRVNIVLWPGGEKREDCLVFETLDEVFKEIAKYPADDVYVVGGAMMYATMLGYCSEVIVTKVAANRRRGKCFLKISTRWKISVSFPKANLWRPTAIPFVLLPIGTIGAAVACIIKTRPVHMIRGACLAEEI